MLIYCKADFEANGLPLTAEQKAAFDKTDKNGNKYQLRDLRKRGQGDRREDRPNMYFPIYYCQETAECSLDYHEGWIEIYPVRGDGSDGRWRWGKDRVKGNLEILEAKKVRGSEKWGIEYRVYLNPALNKSEDDEEQSDEVEERDSKSKSFWNSPDLSTDVARRQMKMLFERPVFDFPKSVDFIKKAIYMGTDSGDIILDFFSGSATTAHAVMEVNAEDGGKRRYILIQLPEICDEKSEAHKAGYRNICEIGKERVRRAGKKLTDTDGQMQIGEEDNNPLDIGFRAFKLDSSNLSTWDATPVDEVNIDDLIDRMNTMVNRVKPDRSDMDMVCEIMLKLGIPLTSTINKVAVNTKSAYVVKGDSLLLVCLAADIAPEDVEVMAGYAPMKIVISRDSFANDTAMANAHYILRDRGIELKLV